MDSLPVIIKDLALILVLAGMVTLLFKRLRQPLILGYIVAGFICGPHLSVFPTVADHESVETWAAIGVIFLMFTLGLEFSFKKLIKMGPPPIIAASTIIFCMIGLGALAGRFFGWSQMNSLFLGGMLAMSSTTVIFKALDDMGLRQQKFASSVLGALVVEDMLGILLMVILSTMAVSNSLEGSQLVNSLLQLALVLVVWFTVGIFLIPTILRKARPLMSYETLLIVSLGLCFLMVVIAVGSGYSAAFGAFMMGSILAETVEAEHINTVVGPVKDLFGAIFFISVGMLVDPAIIVEYWVPIVVLIVVIVVGQSVFGTLGFLLSGQPLRVAMQCGFSMAQIGEFAFIIASLGVSLHVTDEFLYPVVVAVSVITTFLTPYMIRLALPAYGKIERFLPIRMQQSASHEGNAPSPTNRSTWRTLILTMIKQTVAYAFICMTILTISLTWLLPLCRNTLTHWPGNTVCGVLTLVLMSPLLHAIVMRKNHSIEFRKLWAERIANRSILIFTVMVRYAIAMFFVYELINYLSPYSSLLHWIVAAALVGIIAISRHVKSSSQYIDHLFLRNLQSRDTYARRSGKAAPEYAGQLLTHDVHLTILQLPQNTTLAGKTLGQLDLQRTMGVMVSAIVRQCKRINIPRADTVLFPGDRLQIIGNDASIKAITDYVRDNTLAEVAVPSEDEMVLRSLTIRPESVLSRKTVRNSRLREDYGCMLVGFQQPDGQIALPQADRLIQDGDILWIVGEPQAIRQLLSASNGDE